MGMFDSVFASCPKCGEEVEFQSKAGDCFLTSYHLHSVPRDIAESLNGEVVSCQCGEILRIVTDDPFPPDRIRMRVE